MELGLAHWIYLAGMVVGIGVMIARKNIVIPAVTATFLTAWAFTGDLAKGLQSIFMASLTAASELFNIFLIIALVTAMLGALRQLGADRRMIEPFRLVMRNGHASFWVISAITYAISLFFWPTPAVPLISAILLPAAIRAGLPPLNAALAVAITGQGMALSSDYVLQVAPGISAKAAGVSTATVADRALVASLITGGVALALGYLMSRKKILAPAAEHLLRWEDVAETATATHLSPTTEPARRHAEPESATRRDAGPAREPEPAPDAAGPSSAAPAPGPVPATASGIAAVTMAAQPAPPASTTAPSATTATGATAMSGTAPGAAPGTAPGAAGAGTGGGAGAGGIPRPRGTVDGGAGDGSPGTRATADGEGGDGSPGTRGIGDGEGGDRGAEGRGAGIGDRGSGGGGSAHRWVDDVPTPEPADGGPPVRRSKAFAVVVPLALGALVLYMLLGKFTGLVPETTGSDAAAMVGGVVAVLLLASCIALDGRRSLETCAEHVVDGLVFSMKAMGIVLPIAGFFFIGNDAFAGKIMGLGDGARSPNLLFDLVNSAQKIIPDNSFVMAFGILIIGMVTGLDGSGFAGLPLTGSLSGALGPGSGVDPATLAAIGQMGCVWSGGGVLIAWSSLIAVAGFARVHVLDLVRQAFLPVVAGLVVATVFTVLLF